MNHLKPSIFLSFPWESVCDKSEYEAIALSIMRARVARGDKWPLSYVQYREARLGAGVNPQGSEAEFNHVIRLIPDAIGAIRFCDDWAKAARKATQP